MQEQFVQTSHDEELEEMGGGLSCRSQPWRSYKSVKNALTNAS